MNTIASEITQVGNGIQVHKKTDPFSKVFKNGLVLWRPCHFFASGSQLADVGFVSTDRGSFMAKIAIAGTGCDFIFEPVVIPYSVFGKECRGITVFVNEEIPANWTHLVVTGVSRLFQTTSEKADGIKGKGAVFASVGKPYTTKDYLMFRRRTYDLHRSYMNSPIETIVPACEKVWPKEERPGTLRCVMSFFREDPDAMLKYCHFEEV
jgi:hypothetical protein